MYMEKNELANTTGQEYYAYNPPRFAQRKTEKQNSRKDHAMII